MEGDTKSRWEKYRDRKIEPPLPPLMAGGYIAAAFMEAGLVAVGGMSPVRLSWTEIQAYAEATGEIETPFEKRMLRKMSAAYLEGYRLGEDPLAIEPWRPQL